MEPEETNLLGDSLTTAADVRVPDVIDTKRYLSRLLTEVLTPREERIIRIRYRIGSKVDLDSEDEVPYEAITKYVAGTGGDPVTRERIRQIEIKAIKKLRRVLVLKLGRRDATGSKYVDMQTLANIFDVSK